MAWDVLSHAQPPVSPRDGFSGFQGKTPEEARGHGKKVLHEICPAQVLHSLSTRLNPLTRFLALGRSLDLPVS